MSERIRALRAQIRGVKREIARLEELRPGTLSQQYNVCGSPGCRCKTNPPRKHGPYYQLSYTRKGKGGTKAVKKPDLTAIRAELASYAHLRKLVDRWIDLATELSDLKLELRAAAQPPHKRP